MWRKPNCCLGGCCNRFRERITSFIRCRSFSCNLFCFCGFFGNVGRRASESLSFERDTMRFGVSLSTRLDVREWKGKPEARVSTLNVSVREQLFVFWMWGAVSIVCSVVRRSQESNRLGSTVYVWVVRIVYVSLCNCSFVGVTWSLHTESFWSDVFLTGCGSDDPLR